MSQFLINSLNYDKADFKTLDRPTISTTARSKISAKNNLTFNLTKSQQYFKNVKTFTLNPKSYYEEKIKILFDVLNK